MFRGQTMRTRLLPALIIVTLLGANACAEFDAVLSGNQIVNGKAIVKGAVKAPNRVLSLQADPAPGHALQESPAANAIVTLTDGAGTPVPGIGQVTTDGNGQYRINDIPPNRAYVVTATLVGKDGKTYALKSLARTVNLFNTVDLSTNTTMVTEAITASWQGLVADYNPETFKRASEVVAINLTNETLPDLAHREAVVSAMATWVQTNPSLADTLTQLRSEMAKQLPESAQVMAKANPTGLGGWGPLGAALPTGSTAPGTVGSSALPGAPGTAVPGTGGTSAPTTSTGGATPAPGASSSGGTGNGQALPNATPTPRPTATPTPTPRPTASPTATPRPTPTPRPSPTPTPVPTPTPTPMPTPTPVPLANAIVEIHPRHIFKNAVVYLKKGGTVRWRSMDGESHNIKPKPGGLAFQETGGVNPNATSIAITFSQPGEYEYVCELHQLLTIQPKIIVVP